MALANLAEWNEEKKVATWAQPNVSACGSACGAGDKLEEKPAAQAVVEGVLHLLEGHAVQLFAGVFGENVTVLTALVALVGDVPLKGKIRFHGDFPFPVYPVLGL